MIENDYNCNILIWVSGVAEEEMGIFRMKGSHRTSEV